MNVYDLSCKDIRLLSKLAKVAEDAHEDYQIIQSKYQYSFGLNKKKIQVIEINDSEYFGTGYLTVDGTFEYEDNWWGGRSWSIKLTEQSIYELYRAELMNKLDGQDDIDFRSFNASEEEISLSYLAPYFRDFVSRLKGDAYQHFEHEKVTL